MDSLTTRQYAALHGVTESTVRRWINEFLIYAEKIGGRFSIPFDEPPPIYDPITEDTDPITGNPVGETDFPEPEPSESLGPEEEEEEPEFLGEEEEEEEEPEDCRNPSDFDKKDLRKIHATRESAENYAGDIPVPTLVFKRCSDGLFQVVITY